MGSMTPSLIREIKQIGGPDLNSIYSSDSNENSLSEHAFILIGRRGLCRFNGIYKIKDIDKIKSDNYNLKEDVDPNDCYFEDLSNENAKNANTEKEFYHIIDLRTSIDLNNDNRFSYFAPTVSTVSPNKGSIHGGMEIKISGINFGEQTTDIREILVRGVSCGDFILLGPNLISCITRGSTILGPGAGNVLIKLRNGYESPKYTCKMFEYIGDKKEQLDDLKKTLKIVSKMPDLPIYLNSNYHDQKASLFDHLLFEQNNIKQKIQDDLTNNSVNKIDSMVRATENKMLDIVNQSNVMINKQEPFRRKRFNNIIKILEPCNDK